MGESDNEEKKSSKSSGTSETKATPKKQETDHNEVDSRNGMLVILNIFVSIRISSSCFLYAR